jgi:hypothetical protein
MVVNDTFLDVNLLSGVRRDDPLMLPWPMPGNAGELLRFHSATEWRDFISSFSLNPAIPQIVGVKFKRAQMLYFLSWLYLDLIKAGELAALTTLELALRDRYGSKLKKKGERLAFAKLLKYMCADGLTDEKLPLIRRVGGSVIPLLNGNRKPTLAEIRNQQAHGDPFDGLPRAGLLELVRDLIEYLYRDMIPKEEGR